MTKINASKVLKRYEAGERDFRGVNLQGQSFKGQNLSEADFSQADFSNADIRGANFTNAILRGVKFCGAKAGLPFQQAIGLIISSLVMSALLALFAGLAGILAGDTLEREVLQVVADQAPEAVGITHVLASVSILITLITIWIVLFFQGLRASALVAFLGLIVLGTIAWVISVTFSSLAETHLVVAVACSFAVAIAWGGGSTIVATLFSAVSGACFGAVLESEFSALFGAVFGTTAIIGGVIVAWLHFNLLPSVGSIFGALIVIVPAALLGGRLGGFALAGDEKHAWVRSIALSFAAIGGTRFYNADLTDADFTQATLKSTDFRKANIIRTCWKDTIKLARARVGNTILADAAVRELLVTGNGYKKSYVDANLRGANLNRANLNYANLKRANLSEATLQVAELREANLTEIQAINTDFTRAYLTGACIEAWNIEPSTILKDVDCQYVFLLEYPNQLGSRERRPHDSNQAFQPGEFTKLFEEVFNTVDLIFRKGIDWKAFIAAFKKVQVENEDTELTIQRIENKGDGVVVVKVSVPQNTNKAKIHQDFTQNYDLALKAIEEKYKVQLAAKENEIAIYREKSADIKEIITTLSKSMSEQSKFQIYAKNIGAVGENFQNPQIEVGDTIHNYAPEQKQNLAEAAAEIKKLLEQLSQTYPTNTTTEKMIVAAKAVEAIENNRTLMERIFSALKAGGTSALEQALDHPAASFVINALENWQQTKES